MIALLAVLAWLTALYRLPRHGRREPAAWALSGTLAALALGLSLKVPAVYAAVEDGTGGQNLAQLIKDVSVVLSAFGTQLVLLHLLHPPASARRRSRARALVTGLAVSVMVVAFLLAATAESLDDLRVHLADAGLVEFRGIYLLFMTWAFTDIARLCRRFARLADDRALALGLRLIAVGGIVGLGYVLSGAIQVWAAGADNVLLVERAQRASDALIALATLLVVLGSTWPALADRLGVRRGQQPTPDLEAPDLQTLWRDVTLALPDLVLPLSTHQALNAREQLYRQVIEVEDARLTLRSLLDAGLDAAAAQAVVQSGLAERDRAAAIEGIGLALAMERLRTDPAVLSRSTERGAEASRGGEADSTVIPADSLEHEVARLSAVGRWYGNASLVATARRLLDERDQAIPSRETEAAHGRSR